MVVPIGPVPQTDERDQTKQNIAIQQLFSFIYANPRQTVLTASKTFYVRSDGVDTNTGSANTAADAFLTIQKAIDTVYDKTDLAGYSVVIQVAAGTYTGEIAMAGSPVGATNPDDFILTLRGDTATPTNVVINNGFGVQIYDGAILNLEGFKIISGDHGVKTAGSGAQCYMRNMNFGACTNYQIYSFFSGLNYQDSATITFSGNAKAAIHVEGSYFVLEDGASQVLTGTPAYSVAFIHAREGGLCFMGNGGTITGAATGLRFYVDGGTIYNNIDSSLTYLPGNVAGQLLFGGRYNEYLSTGHIVTTDDFTYSLPVTFDSTPSTNQQIVHSGSSWAQSKIGTGALVEGLFDGIAKTRANTPIGGTIVALGDVIHSAYYYGDDGSAYRQAARYMVKVDGTPGASDMPGRHEWWTSPDGSATPALRVTIDNAGNVVNGNAAILAGATNGFTYIATCSGAPVGTPTTYTGRAPLVIDSAANKLYFYSGGAWRDAGP